MLPICAWCKNIRDDGGYWTRVEAYVASHSAAEFTHCICPSCVEKLDAPPAVTLAELTLKEAEARSAPYPI